MTSLHGRILGFRLLLCNPACQKQGLDSLSGGSRCCDGLGSRSLWHYQAMAANTAVPRIHRTRVQAVPTAGAVVCCRTLIPCPSAQRRANVLGKRRVSAQKGGRGTYHSLMPWLPCPCTSRYGGTSPLHFNPPLHAASYPRPFGPCWRPGTHAMPRP